MAGLRTIPAIVQDYSAKDGAVLALIENMQRSDLNFFEEAAAIYELMRDRSMTQEETARRLGMSQPALANKVRLLRLSGEEQRIILENRLTERHARALLRVEDPIRRVQALKAIVERKLNVAQTEALIKDLLEREEPAKKPKRTFYREGRPAVHQHDRPCGQGDEKRRHPSCFPEAGDRRLF